VDHGSAQRGNTNVLVACFAPVRFFDAYADDEVPDAWYGVTEGPNGPEGNTINIDGSHTPGFDGTLTAVEPYARECIVKYIGPK
jgi:hypothetical protein